MGLSKKMFLMPNRKRKRLRMKTRMGKGMKMKKRRKKKILLNLFPKKVTKKELLPEGEKLGEIEHWLLLGDFTKFLSPIVNFFIINYYPTNKKRKKKLVPMAFF